MPDGRLGWEIGALVSKNLSGYHLCNVVASLAFLLFYEHPGRSRPLPILLRYWEFGEGRWQRLKKGRGSLATGIFAVKKRKLILLIFRSRCVPPLRVATCLGAVVGWPLACSFGMSITGWGGGLRCCPLILFLFIVCHVPLYSVAFVSGWIAKKPFILRASVRRFRTDTFVRLSRHGSYPLPLFRVSKVKTKI